MTEALIGWHVEEKTLEALGTKNRLLPHLGSLGMFTLVRMLIESSPGLDPLGSLGQMPYGRDYPSLPRFGRPFPPLGPSLWPAQMGTEVWRTPSITSSELVGSGLANCLRSPLPRILIDVIF